jgi:hypothetical protein
MRDDPDDGHRTDFSIQRHVANLVASLPVPGITPDIVNGWIHSRNVVFLLDGLDEMEDEFLPIFTEYLNNTFFRQNRGIPTVIASRILEYKVLERDEETMIRGLGAVTLKPLSDEDIAKYLEAAGAEALSKALPGDKELKELARNPLTLSMMSLAYQGRDAAEIEAGLSREERQQKLFDNYIDRIMQREAFRRAGRPWDPQSRETLPTRYPRRLVDRYLANLAIALSERGKTRFPPKAFGAFLLEEKIGSGHPFGSLPRLAEASVAAFWGLVAAVLFMTLPGSAEASLPEAGTLAMVPVLATLATAYLNWGGLANQRQALLRHCPAYLAMGEKVIKATLIGLIAGTVAAWFGLSGVTLVALLGGTPFDAAAGSVIAAGVVFFSLSILVLAAQKRSSLEKRRKFIGLFSVILIAALLVYAGHSLTGGAVWRELATSVVICVFFCIVLDNEAGEFLNITVIVIGAALVIAAAGWLLGQYANLVNPFWTLCIVGAVTGFFTQGCSVLQFKRLGSRKASPDGG